jgi:hypothetical protein
MGKNKQQRKGNRDRKRYERLIKHQFRKIKQKFIYGVRPFNILFCLQVFQNFRIQCSLESISYLKFCFQDAEWKNEWKKFNEYLAKFGLYIKDMTGDGNCLFR